LYACNFDFEIQKKISADEYLNEELTLLKWDEVDQYPVFENCLEFDDILILNNCFIKTISDKFKSNLYALNLVIDRTIIEKVNLSMKVDKKGKISLEKINVSDQNNTYKEIIKRSFEKTILDLPIVYPAVKRGQQVDVIFNIPIILSTEN
tara:strand:+ start:1225 stop:1674 length:450 start_codon:yes stop_codon:yes gene_type:complete